MPTYHTTPSCQFFGHSKEASLTHVALMQVKKRSFNYLLKQNKYNQNNNKYFLTGTILHAQDTEGNGLVPKDHVVTANVALQYHYPK
jgi:hypothetical protein